MQQLWKPKNGWNTKFILTERLKYPYNPILVSEKFSSSSAEAAREFEKSRSLTSEITNLIRSTVPDRFPTKVSRIKMQKPEDELHVIYPINKDGEFVPVRINRERYPRIERNKDGSFAKASVLDEPYAIRIGDELYFVRNSGTQHNGKPFSDEDYKTVSSYIELARVGTENKSVVPSVLKRSIDSNIPDKLGQLLPIES